MRYQVQVKQGKQWKYVTEVYSEELAYWWVATRQREGKHARVVEIK